MQGYCGGTYCPSGAGPGQMQHFVYDDGLNAFRLHVGWQYLVNNNLSGPLDPTFFADYDGICKPALLRAPTVLSTSTTMPAETAALSVKEARPTMISSRSDPSWRKRTPGNQTSFLAS